jgi:antitoxin MazE
MRRFQYLLCDPSRSESREGESDPYRQLARGAHPKAMLDQCGFGRRVEMRVEGDSLIITPARAARSGWEEAFRAMAERGDDAALFPEDLEHSFDETEWEW